MKSVNRSRSSLVGEIKLPSNFRAPDILTFHKRDPKRIAERVDGNTLQKGVLWKESPACLTIQFRPRVAEVRLDIDGPAAPDEANTLLQQVTRIIGLNQKVDQFERAHREHPALGALIQRNAGLRVPLSASPFEALTWAITGQQISLTVALSLRRKLIQAAGIKHSSGLFCHPNPEHITRLTEEELGKLGFSRTKAHTLVTLSSLVRDGTLPLDQWINSLSVTEVHDKLSQIRGIGPWTINYALLRGFGWLDGSLHGDVAVRNNLQVLLNAPEKITEKEAKLWLEQFPPWRALVAAHLWAMKAFNA
jgi:DNA-3-methyladenine glycosylase II